MGATKAAGAVNVGDNPRFLTRSLSTLSMSSGGASAENDRGDEGTENMAVSTTEDENSKGAMCGGSGSTSASSGDDNEATGGGGEHPHRKRVKDFDGGGMRRVGSYPDLGRARTDSFLSSSDDDTEDDERRGDGNGHRTGGGGGGGAMLPPSTCADSDAGQEYHHRARRSTESGVTGITGATGLSLSYSLSIASPDRDGAGTPVPGDHYNQNDGHGTNRGRIRTDTNGSSKVTQVTQVTHSTTTSNSRSGRSSRASSDMYSLAFSNSSGGTPVSSEPGGQVEAMGTVSENSDGNSGGASYGGSGRHMMATDSTEEKKSSGDEEGNGSVLYHHQPASTGHSFDFGTASKSSSFEETGRVGGTKRSPAGQKTGGETRQQQRYVNQKPPPTRTPPQQPSSRGQHVDGVLSPSNLSSSSESPSPVRLNLSPSKNGGARGAGGGFRPAPRPVSPAQMQQLQQPVMTTIDGRGSAPAVGQQQRSRLGSADGSVATNGEQCGGNRARVTSDDLRHLPPVHNFFGSVLGNDSANANAMARASPRYYDSDGSGNGSVNGSVVYNKNGGATGAGAGAGGHGGMGGGGRGRHERFSSVDSSGSFVRRPSPRSSMAAGGVPPAMTAGAAPRSSPPALGAPPPPPPSYGAPPPQPPGQPYPSTPYSLRGSMGDSKTPTGLQSSPRSPVEATPHASNVSGTPSTRMLPYHVRRQLMQQKRERDDEEARLRQDSYGGHRAGGGAGGRAADRRPQGGGGGKFRGRRPARLTEGGLPPSRQHQQSPPALTPTGPSGRKHAGGKKSYTLPPSGYGASGAQLAGNGMRLSSADSYDLSPENNKETLPPVGALPRHPPPSQQQQQYRQQRPPPPPPGQTGSGAPTTHIRADSTGSVSSLGSNLCGPGSLSAAPMRSLTDRLGGDAFAGYREQEQRGRRQGQPPVVASHQQQPPTTASQQRGFVRNFVSPKKEKGGAGRGGHRREPSIEDQTQDFHERNQAFLHRAERQKAKMHETLTDLSPQRRTMRALSPRPPSTRGSHRPGLASIDNDNWEDETPEKERGQQRRTEKDAGIVGQHSYYPPSNRHHQTSGGGDGGGGGYGATVLASGRVAKDNTITSHGRVASRSSKGSKSRSSRSKSSGDREGRGRLNGKGTGNGSRGRGGGGYARRGSSSSESSDSITFSSDETSDSEFDASSFLGSFGADHDAATNANERTSLLPPPGISTHESQSSGRSRPRNALTPERETASTRKKRKKQGGRAHRDSPGDRRADRRDDGDWRSRKRGGRESRYQRGRRERRDGYRHDQGDRRGEYSSQSESTEESSSSPSTEYDRWERKKAGMLDREREKFMSKWRSEARAELEALRAEEESRRWHNKLRRWGEGGGAALATGVGKFLANAEAVICNMPSTIGAVALALATLGVVWFKFAEENLDSCQPVHFHSSQCSFPEFPGCFYCDTSSGMYRFAVNFHYACSTLAGLLTVVFFAKVVLAWRVVIDELSSPTTSSPAGLICMTMVCVFAGRGWIGQVLVTAAATMHFCLVVWFLYMALAYRILPDPSWYPNTVGIGLSAVKMWLYYSTPGYFLMAISLCLNIAFFPISVFRVSVNNKISAPVGWIQMSAPSVALYSLTIMAQPSFEEEHPDITALQRFHRMVYLPGMHFMFVISVVGALSSAQSLLARWKSFSAKAFSPAHAAFCFPTLAHANAVQAYRGAIDSYSNVAPGSPFKIMIYTYWVLVLVGGTIATFIITAKFFYNIPSWTLVDVDEEEEPPAPSDTLMVHAEGIFAGETMRQSFVSPAVLQANETGVLLALPRGHGGARYRRTRKVTALGFEPIMSLLELDAEREALLEMVARNPPKRRRNTLSVPGVDFRYGYGDFGSGNAGVFDIESGGGGMEERQRAETMDGRYQNRRTNTDLY